MRLITSTPSFTQGLVARQEPHVVTQTIVREFTTLTTVITLGTIPTNNADPPPAPANEARDDSGASGGGLNNLEIGAILGSIVAAISVIAMWYCYCYLPGTKRRLIQYESSYSEESMVYMSPRRPPPVAEMVPGGPRYPTYRAIPIPNPRNPPVQHHL
jgi:hypothetical protein